MSNNLTSEVFQKISFSPSCPLEEVTLDDNMLTELPSNLPVTMKRLSATRNKIISVKFGQLSGLVNLQLLDLQGNRIRNIEPGSFRHLSGLSNLNLNNNQISELPPKMPPHLKKLHLSGNRIRFLYKSENPEHGGMENLNQLQVVYLLFLLSEC